MDWYFEFPMYTATGIVIANALGAWIRNRITTRGQFLRLVLRNAAVAYPILYVWGALLKGYFKSEGWVAVWFSHLFC